jgi:hypothetical protein
MEERVAELEQRLAQVEQQRCQAKRWAGILFALAVLLAMAGLMFMPEHRGLTQEAHPRQPLPATALR